MNAINEIVSYKCPCGAAIEWTMRIAVAVPESPGKTAYPGLVASLREFIEASGRTRLRVHLVTRNGDEVVFRWSGPSRVVTVSVGDTTYGRLNLDTGEYERTGLLAMLAELLDEADTSFIAAAIRYGEEKKHCAFCRHPLKDPQSIHTGYGPDCAAIYGLEWPLVKKPVVKKPVALVPQPSVPLDEHAEDVFYRCACGLEIEWRVSPAGAVNITQFPSQVFHRGLVGELRRMIAHDGRRHLRMHLLTGGNDGVVFEWNAPFRLVTLTDGASTTYGTLNLDTGEYVESRELEGMAGLLRDADVDLLAAAARYAEETGFCAFCDHHLTDPRSVSAHCGPTCARHYGIAWGP